MEEKKELWSRHETIKFVLICVVIVAWIIAFTQNPIATTITTAAIVVVIFITWLIGILYLIILGRAVDRDYQRRKQDKLQSINVQRQPENKALQVQNQRAWSR